jgi:primosomal protein N' (replication factor Y) (superfamily II helicase)
MDKDTTQKRGSHEEIYEGFKNNDFDILIGTQIIAKGWDLPNVNLVGVIAADTTLNIPDYQSAEKTFSLLTQVAGRTGRSYHPGEVIIQTYNPDNYAIKYAKNHDYLGFFKEELESRKKYNYPPFSKFIKLVNRNKDEEKAREKANKLTDLLKGSLKDDYVDILGPAESFIYRKGGFYHWQIILKVKEGKNKKNNNDEKILNLNKVLKKIVPIDWNIDVEPDNLL